jgi:uncharacterized membrane protein
MVMTKQQLLRAIDKGRIENAIRAAELRTSGEICVSVSRVFWGNVETAAKKAFDRMGITDTRERNGVLFFVVPSRRKFVVLGDAGIHEKVGQAFWTSVVSAVTDKFRSGHFTEGLVKGIEAVGEQLATHFPYDAASDKNELSNEVDFDC